MEKTRRIINNYFHPSRLIYTLMGIIIFVLLGYYIPKIWVQYAPIEYYSVIQPVKVDKLSYKPCDPVTTTFVRTSLINSTADATVQLYLARGKETVKISPTLFNGQIIIIKSQAKVFHTRYDLPCNLENGEYYIQAIVNFKVQGIEKTYFWATESFLVSK